MPSNEKRIPRIRRAEPQNQQQPIGSIDAVQQNSTDANAQQIDATNNLSAREEIELIKRENLTGRQLRIARRAAQKHGLQVTSDLDAVRVLRKNGIEPFQSTSNNILKNAANNSQNTAPSNLPSTVRRTDVAQPVEPLDTNTRELEVHQIQKELVKRRRRRIAATVAKLICFIAIPTIIAGYYFYRVATPMYASFTEFVIQKADNPASAGAGVGGLLSSSLLATAQDSIAVQGYLSSREAMNRLDGDLGFKNTFQGEKIDSIQRLDNQATNEAAYKVYKKHVQIGFDPTEGIIKMEVVTPSPEKSLEFSKALIGYAEQQVDHLTQRLREDQMKGARDGYEKAELDFSNAQSQVVALQEKLGVLDPTIEISAQMSLIQQLEADVQQKQLELIELRDNPRPNRTKLAVLERSISSRETMIKDMRNELTQGTSDAASLAKITAELQSAQAQLVLRQEFLASSLASLETSRVEANRQTRYLSMAVAPVAPDEASYPRAFENTLLAAIVFAGIYLMVSLTASVLREQLTSG
ncbi:capsule biosynthesis protein [Amylibacter sp. SFDW26]|uniref:capsule biosynthesis protein n=1 Tax=Amylibacter sp. SFDW26 TaxID=2652722 RepID=UPI001261AD2E|nr:capsule biosynthesis protein [Amylibacter sp. SFDW26]KAB7613837.1 capsule biosynthesis protein [Amylibacter sp. SFDW26]